MEKKNTDINTFLINKCGIQTDKLIDDILDNVENENKYIINIENNQEKYINSNIFLIFNLLENISINEIKNDIEKISENNIKKWKSFIQQKESEIILDIHKIKIRIEDGEKKRKQINNEIQTAKKENIDLKSQTILSNNDPFEMESYSNKLDVLHSQIKKKVEEKKVKQIEISDLIIKKKKKGLEIINSKNIMEIIQKIEKNIDKYQILLKTIVQYKHNEIKKSFFYKVYIFPFIVILFGVFIGFFFI